MRVAEVRIGFRTRSASDHPPGRPITSCRPRPQDTAIRARTAVRDPASRRSARRASPPRRLPRLCHGSGPARAQFVFRSSLLKTRPTPPSRANSSAAPVSCASCGECSSCGDRATALLECLGPRAAELVSDLLGREAYDRMVRVSRKYAGTSRRPSACDGARRELPDRATSATARSRAAMPGPPRPAPGG